MVKVSRSYPPPESLMIERQKVNGVYNKPDVVEQLRKDFNNKCYICELKDLQDPEIEHLLPHKNGKYPDRKFDWENLFWSCGHCNKVKLQQKYDLGILDCCKENPEEFISFRLIQDNVKVIAKNIGDKKSEITAQLVYEVFNLENTGMRTYKSAMRLKELTKEMNMLYNNLEAFQKNPESKIIKRKLQALLRKESQFAAFKREYVREHKEEFPQLYSYML